VQITGMVIVDDHERSILRNHHRHSRAVFSIRKA
jgi:hypothetical protein